MPIYEFSCIIHGRFERIFPLSLFEEIKKGVMCEFDYGDSTFCGEVALMEWSKPAKMELGKPTNIFKNEKGQVRIPTSHNEKPPKGFEKIELRSTLERTKFEHEMQKKQDDATEIVTIRNQMIKDETTKNRHDDTNAKMSSLTKDSENPTAAKELLKSAMNRSRKKILPRKDTAFKFDINHNNNSNLVK